MRWIRRGEMVLPDLRRAVCHWIIICDQLTHHPDCVAQFYLVKGLVPSTIPLGDWRSLGWCKQETFWQGWHWPTLVLGTALSLSPPTPSLQLMSNFLLFLAPWLVHIQTKFAEKRTASMSRSNEHHRGPMSHSIFTRNHIIGDDFVQLQARCDVVRNLRASSVNQRNRKWVPQVAPWGMFP